MFKNCDPTTFRAIREAVWWRESDPSHPTSWGWGFDPSPPKRFRGLPHSPALSRTSVEGSESPQTPPKNTSTKHEALPMNPPPEYGARGFALQGYWGGYQRLIMVGNPLIRVGERRSPIPPSDAPDGGGKQAAEERRVKEGAEATQV